MISQQYMLERTQDSIGQSLEINHFQVNYAALAFVTLKTIFSSIG